MALTKETGPSPFDFTGDFSSGTQTGTSPSFNPPADSLIVAKIQASEFFANQVSQTIVTSSGLTFTKRQEWGSAFNGATDDAGNGYTAIHTAPCPSSGSRTVDVQIDRASEHGFTTRVDIEVWSGHDIASAIGNTNHGGPTADTGTGISPTLIAATAAIGRVTYSAVDNNGNSGAQQAASSTDTYNSSRGIDEISAGLSAHRNSNHTSGSAVPGSMNANGSADVAGIWNWTAIEIKQASAGGSSVTGTGDVSTPDTTVAGAGVAGHSGTGAITSAIATASGVGKVGHIGTGALTNPVPVVVGAGTKNGAVQNITGTGAINSSTITMSGAGKRGSMDLGGQIDILSNSISVIAGSGTKSGNAKTGTGAITSSVATMSGAGKRGVMGTSAFTWSIPLIAGSGTASGPGPAHITGSGALLINGVSCSGAGKRGAMSTGALTSSVAIVNGIALKNGVGPGGADFPISHTEARNTPHPMARRYAHGRPTWRR